MNDFQQTKPLLGTGIYTDPDIALLLGIPYAKSLRWITSFWNDRFGIKYNYDHSWNVDLIRAVNFHTLIELITFYQLAQAGVKIRKSIKAHDIISAQYYTHYPFAMKMVLEGLRTDGTKVFLELKDGTTNNVDSTQQFEFTFIKEILKKLDFDADSMAVRYWPLGKEKSIVCDPHHQFGRPVIDGTNINSEVLYKMYLGDEPIDFIADLYKISSEQVNDAIYFHKSLV